MAIQGDVGIGLGGAGAIDSGGGAQGLGLGLGGGVAAIGRIRSALESYLERTGSQPRFGADLPAIFWFMDSLTVSEGLSADQRSAIERHVDEFKLSLRQMESGGTGLGTVGRTALAQLDGILAVFQADGSVGEKDRTRVGVGVLVARADTGTARGDPSAVEAGIGAIEDAVEQAGERLSPEERMRIGAAIERIRERVAQTELDLDEEDRKTVAGLVDEIKAALSDGGLPGSSAARQVLEALGDVGAILLRGR